MLAAVTGANGFLGSALTRALLDRGHTVRAIVRPGGHLDSIEGLPVELVHADLTDPKSLRAPFSGADWVFHTAALYSLGDDEKAHNTINVIGTRNVMDSASEMGVKRVVYTSSATTVGSAPEDGLANEDGVWDLAALNIPYFTSKFLGEHEAMAAGARGLDVVTVNPTIMFGERERPSSPTGRWLIEFLSGRMLAVPPVQMNVVHVDDVAVGHVLAAERGRRGERYILSHWNTTAEEFFHKLGHLVGRRTPVVVPYEVAFAGATVSSAVLDLLGLSANVSTSLIRYAHKRMLVTNAKAVRELGFSVSPIDESLEKTIRWFNGSGLVKRRL